MAWKLITEPESSGGLGIHDLPGFAHALRLRWLWWRLQQPARPWVGTGTPSDHGDHALFAASRTVTIGNGDTTTFWHCSWLEGRPLRDAYPLLFNTLPRTERCGLHCRGAGRSLT